MVMGSITRGEGTLFFNMNNPPFLFPSIKNPSLFTELQVPESGFDGYIALIGWCSVIALHSIADSKMQSVVINNCSKMETQNSVFLSHRVNMPSSFYSNIHFFYFQYQIYPPIMQMRCTRVPPPTRGKMVKVNTYDPNLDTGWQRPKPRLGLGRQLNNEFFL